MSNSDKVVVELRDIVPVRKWVRALGWIILTASLAAAGYLLIGGWGASLGALVAAVVAGAAERAWGADGPAVALRLTEHELVLPTGPFKRKAVHVALADVRRAELCEGRVYVEAGTHASMFEVGQIVGGEAAARTLVETLISAVGRVSEQHAVRLRDRAAMAAELRGRAVWVTYALVGGLLCLAMMLAMQTGVPSAAPARTASGPLLVLLVVGVGLERGLGAWRFGAVLAGSLLAAMLAAWSLGVSATLSVGLSTLGVVLAVLVALVWLRLQAVLPAELRVSGLVVGGVGLLGLAEAATLARMGGWPQWVGVALGLALSVWAVVGAVAPLDPPNPAFAAAKKA